MAATAHSKVTPYQCRGFISPSLVSTKKQIQGSSAVKPFLTGQSLEFQKVAFSESLLKKKKSTKKSHRFQTKGNHSLIGAKKNLYKLICLSLLIQKKANSKTLMPSPSRFRNLSNTSSPVASLSRLT